MHFVDDNKRLSKYENETTKKMMKKRKNNNENENAGVAPRVSFHVHSQRFIIYFNHYLTCIAHAQLLTSTKCSSVLSAALCCF